MDRIYFQSKGAEDFRFLSNFHRSVFRDGTSGIVWQSVEHYYQSQKALDCDEFVWVASSATPKLARQRGQKVKTREDWDVVKEDVMREALGFKFRQSEDLKKMLLMTEGFELYEWAPWDGYWGTGKDGNGKNRLGILLMELREQLKKE